MALAMPQAIERSLATPTMRERLRERKPISDSCVVDPGVRGMCYCEARRLKIVRYDSVSAQVDKPNDPPVEPRKDDDGTKMRMQPLSVWCLSRFRSALRRH